MSLKIGRNLDEDNIQIDSNSFSIGFTFRPIYLWKYCKFGYWNSFENHLAIQTPYFSFAVRINQ